MGSHTLIEKERQSAGVEKVITAAYTITESDLQIYKVFIFNSTGAVAITLPAAAASMAGRVIYIANKNSGASTVVVAAGYGGGNGTATLAQGDLGVFVCDGSYWYQASSLTGT